MTKITIEVRTANAAFRTQDESLDVHAVACLLDTAVRRIAESTPTPGQVSRFPLYDINGNSVGAITVNERESSPDEASEGDQLRLF